MSYVLLVEDNNELRDAMSELLKLHAIDVVVAGDAREALALLRRTKLLPSLVITDLSMAPGNGHELIDGMQAGVWSTVPIFVVTASDDHVSPRVELVFRKPLDSQKLTTLASAVARRCLLSAKA